VGGDCGCENERGRRDDAWEMFFFSSSSFCALRRRECINKGGGVGVGKKKSKFEEETKKRGED